MAALFRRARRHLASREEHRAAHESEEEFRAFFDNAAVGAAQLDLDGRFQKVNDRYCDITGYSREELLRLRPPDLSLPEQRERDGELLRRYLAGIDGTYDVEKRYRRKDGSVIWVHVTSALIRDEAGKPVRSAGVIEDITDRKRAEEALRRYQLLADNTRDVMLFVRREDGRILDANAAAATAYGYTRDELRALTIRDLRAPETRRLAGSQMAEADAHGIRFETVHRRKDGSTFDVEVCSQGATIEGIRTLVSVVRDVTDRKRAERALRESEERLRLFVEHTPAAVAMLDRDMRYLATSRRFVSDYRLKEQDLVGRGHYEVFPEIPDRWKQIHQRCLAGAVERCDEDPFPRPDGTVDWIRWAIHPWRDAAGEIGGVILFSENVTDRKLAVEKLAAERQRLAVTLSSIGDAVIATDEAARVTLVNEVAERLTGWKAEEAIGRPLGEVFAIFDEDTREPAESPVERVLRDGAVVGLANHTALVARDGTERPIADSGAPIRDPQGNVCGVVLVFRDRSEERRAEAIVLRSRRELHDLIEKLPTGVFVGRGGRIVYANPAFASYLGYRFPSDLVGKGPEDVLPPEEREIGRSYVQLEGAPHRSLPGREWRFLRADGQIVTLESAPTREIEYEGGPAVLYAMRDLTELKRMQAQLMQSDRLASVGMLAAGVAHEINNPLAYLSAALDFVDEELKGLGRAAPSEQLAEMGRALADARVGADRVKHVVRDLKTFSRAEEENRAAVELANVIDSSVNMVWNEIRHRARLVKELRPAPPVFANEARLGQVFLNLLINAAQAIPEGHAGEHEIRVSTWTDELGRAVAEVRDSGPGIPAALLGRIFDPFFTTKPVGVGTGLGLSICRNIVRSMDGQIDVESGPGRGAVFRVTLPAARRGVERVAPPPPVGHGRRGRVLVVDDELPVGNAVRRALGREHEVVVLTSAREARVKVADGERFDAIVCDLMMPEMTGMDLHAELEAIAPDQAARMVLLTGGAFTARAAQFLDSVPNARVEKPFDGERLRAIVRELVR